ncbi:MAG: hypothetical protein ACYCVB_08040 [Bacilli bacterium]
MKIVAIPKNRRRRIFFPAVGAAKQHGCLSRKIAAGAFSSRRKGTEVGGKCYSSARSAHLLFKKRQYFASLYLVHLAIEKMLKTLMIVETGQFDYGYNPNIFTSKISLTQDMPEWMRDVCALKLNTLAYELFEPTAHHSIKHILPNSC